MTTNISFTLTCFGILAAIPKYVMGDECTSCVERGCTFCKGNEFFGNPSQCVCGGFDGFFGSCSDHTFGGAPFNSKLDCSFNSQNGTAILCVLIIGVLSICCCSGIVAYKWRNASYLGSGGGIDSSSINQQSSPNVLPVVSSQSPTINQQQVPMATEVAVPIPTYAPASMSFTAVSYPVPSAPPYAL
jgi:hypothetical protein